MTQKLLLLLAICVLMIPAAVSAQQPHSQLDPAQYDPAVDPDIDMFIGDWRDSMPRHTHGSLVERDILTKLEGTDDLHPTRKGAVLVNLDHVSLATLEPMTVTSPTTLSDLQEIFYLIGGQGRVRANGKQYDLQVGSSIIAPPGVEFSIENTGGEAMRFYLVAEPVTRETALTDTLQVAYEFNNNQFLTVHWSHIDRGVLGDKPGMVNMGGLTAVKIDPGTMSQPHSHGPGVEEVWFNVHGDVTLFLGKQLRKLPEGAAYKIPSTGTTAHSNMNFTGDQAKLIHMMKGGRTAEEPWGSLDYEMYDPEVDPDYDMFIGDRLRAIPANTHGCLVERQMLQPLVGPDPLHPARNRSVLEYIKRVSFATLEPGAYTEMYAPEDEQEVYYVDSGAGALVSGGKKYPITPGTGVLVPEGVSYSIANTGDAQLKMYLVVEPVPAGFVPKTEVVLRNDNDYPVSMSVHWSNIDKRLFSANDGLATLRGINPVMLDPMTIAQPHSHEPGVEEVWVALDGDTRLLMGKQLRDLPPGTAYKVPANGMTAHSNINITGKPVKLMWMMVTP